MNAITSRPRQLTAELEMDAIACHAIAYVRFTCMLQHMCMLRLHSCSYIGESPILLLGGARDAHFRLLKIAPGDLLDVAGVLL